MNGTSVVSVIIPTFNAERYIADALRSVRAQHYGALEIIVADDGSTDATVAHVQRDFPDVRCLRLSHRGRPGATRNAGLAAATGPYVCFLDADDLMLPHRVAVQTRFLEAQPSVGIVFMDYANFSEGEVTNTSHFTQCPRLNARIAGDPEIVLGSREATALLIRENIGLPSSMMARTDALRRVKGFPEDLRTSEDFYLTYEIARRYDVGVINDVGSLRRLHGGNITGDALAGLQNFVTCRSRLLTDEDNPENRALLRETICRRELDLACVYGNNGRTATALRYILRALTLHSDASRRNLLDGCRLTARTLAIALGIKRATVPPRETEA